MIDVIDLIPSKDMREALRESERQFTDMEKATIIHNLELPPLRRRELLQELLAETEDETLREQLQYSLADEECLLTRFREASEGYVFGVNVHDEDVRDDDSVDAFFSNFPAAFDYGCASGSSFHVQKWRVHDVAPQGDWWRFDGDCGTVEFDANGEVTSLWLSHERDPEHPDEGQWAPNIIMGEKWPHYQYFEDRWIDLPNLYEQGDIVRVLGRVASYIDQAYDWAVVDADRRRWEEYSGRVNSWLHNVEADVQEPQGILGDYSDMQITLEFLCKDGTFEHDHINPMFIEKWEGEVEGDEAELMQMATWDVRGECSLWWTSSVLKKSILKGLSREVKGHNES